MEAAQRTKGEEAATLRQALELHRAGRLAEAERLYRRVLEAAPETADAWHLLGVLAKQSGDLTAAETLIRRAIGLKDSEAAFWSNLGLVLHDRGRPDAAVTAYDKALSLQPDFADAAYNRGLSLQAQGRLEAAVATLRQAVEIDPAHATAFCGLGLALQQQGRPQAAREAYARAHDLDSALARALWGQLLALPILYESEAEIGVWRARWRAGLEELGRAFDRAGPDLLSAFLDAATAQTNFYLHYQGEDDTELQAAYGALLAAIVGRAFPGLRAPRPRRRRPPGEAIRVGFVSGHFRRHSVMKSHGSWLTGLDRARFEVHAFDLGDGADEVTAEIQATTRYQALRPLPHARQVEAILAADLDILIYLDIGMEPLVQLPAALRLAPVQCASWGHPVTSGLPTMDYFISSALMEPEDAQRHYTETLVTLPSLSISYPRPATDTRVRPAGVAHMAGQGVLYLCAQSLFKLLPRYDEVYARIAARVPEARFLFIEEDSPHLTELFRKRLAGCFAAHGLDPARHLRLVPRLGQAGFLGLNDMVDVVLDSFAWSGCNSTLEALALDKPVVTLPGPMLRGRHGYAMLRRLGLDELIARDVDDYVEIAAALGTEAGRRRALSREIAARKGLLYEDAAPIRALEAFIEGCCRGRA